MNLVQEILLLLLDDEGAPVVAPGPVRLDHALAGAALMDLALRNRIDTDATNLLLLDATPTGEPVLDGVLEEIAASEERSDAKVWLSRLAERSQEIREGALAELIELGILEEKNKRILWVFGSRRYPAVDGRAEREVKLRVMSVLFSDEIPDPRDVAIISLISATGLLSELLSKHDLPRAMERVQQIRKMDLIGREMVSAIQNIEKVVLTAMPPMGAVPHM